MENGIVEKIVAIAILCVISIYGFFKLVVELRRYRARHEFGNAFLERLKNYWDSNGADAEAYGWLIHRSNKMQGQMGSQGIVHSYKPPYQNYILSNYPIILNMLPDLRRALDDDLLSQKLAYQYMSALQESLVRYIGSIEDKQDGVISEIKNPFKWLREGVRDLIALPAYLMVWLGMISEAATRRWVSSLLFSTLSGLVALAGFVSTVITIVVGWDEFLGIIGNLLS